MKGGSKRSASTQRALRVGIVLCERSLAATDEIDLSPKSLCLGMVYFGACVGELDM
jgi:hypothetical protein